MTEAFRPLREGGVAVQKEGAETATFFRLRGFDASGRLNKY
jgi:hypothetical protein